MREEKRNKIIAAFVVNAILLVFIILGVLIAQIVEISVLTRRKNELLEDYNQTLEALERLEDLRDNLEGQSDEYILMFYDLTDHLQTVRVQLKQYGVELPPREEEK